MSLLETTMYRVVCDQCGRRHPDGWRESKGEARMDADAVLVGKWPGNETDEQIQEALRRLS